MASEKYYVYCHTNKINNKKYIGITCRDVYKRWGLNGCNYKSSPYFYAAIKKYGWNNFEHDILFETSDKKEAEEKERELILMYRSYINVFGYNIELGGNYKGKHSKEVCRKISESKKGKPKSEKTKEKISKSLTGKFIGSKNKKSKSVICLDTMKIYESQGRASIETGIDQSDISRCCSHKIKQIKGTHWMYYGEYLEGGENGCEKKSG